VLSKPNGSYNSEDLAILSRVLDEALKEKLEGASVSEEQHKELGSRLGKVIMDRFEAGETDPERLKKDAVESIQQR
jgi:hypothetical protein